MEGSVIIHSQSKNINQKDDINNSNYLNFGGNTSQLLDLRNKRSATEEESGYDESNISQLNQTSKYNLYGTGDTTMTPQQNCSYFDPSGNISAIQNTSSLTPTRQPSSEKPAMSNFEALRKKIKEESAKMNT